jgi:hypothetical protein
MVWEDWRGGRTEGNARNWLRYLVPFADANLMQDFFAFGCGVVAERGNSLAPNATALAGTRLAVMDGKIMQVRRNPINGCTLAAGQEPGA